MPELKKVKAVEDYDGHWFVIPNELEKEFFKDLENEEFVAYGDFSEKYGKYQTGGCLNLTQLYAELE